MQHFRSKHLQKKPARRVFFCDICGHSDLRKKFFTLHMSRHRSKIECKICSGRFLNIERHSKAHSKVASLIAEPKCRPDLNLQLMIMPNSGQRVLRRWNSFVYTISTTGWKISFLAAWKILRLFQKKKNLLHRINLLMKMMMMMCLH